MTPAVEQQGEFRTGDRGLAVVSGSTFRSRPLVCSAIEGMAVFEGDIALGTVDQLNLDLNERHDRGGTSPEADVAKGIGIAGDRFRWPNAEALWWNTEGSLKRCSTGGSTEAWPSPIRLRSTHNWNGPTRGRRARQSSHLRHVAGTVAASPTAADDFGGRLPDRGQTGKPGHVKAPALGGH